MATKRDYYEVLEISKKATQDEIKSAYRKLALKYHPDRNPNNTEAEEKFKEATEAYEILGNSQKRAQYDQFGHSAFEGPATTGGGFSDFGDIFDGFEDIFESFFGRSSRAYSKRRKKGQDLAYEVEIDLKDAVLGKEDTIEIPKTEKCSTCKGTGASPGTSSEKCNYCNGSGQISRSQGFFTFTTTCHKCGGRGFIIKNPCPDCNGSGNVSMNKKISIKIPPGVNNGTKIKISGEGEPSQFGSIPGDLYLIIKVREHEFFKRENYDLICEIPISISQAALGCELLVPTIYDKEVKLKIPAGTQFGKVFRIRGNGVPNLNGFQKGDLYVRIIIEIPTKLTSKQKELLEEFAKLSGEKVSSKSKGFFENIKSPFKS